MVSASVRARKLASTMRKNSERILAVLAKSVLVEISRCKSKGNTC